MTTGSVVTSNTSYTLYSSFNKSNRQVQSSLVKVGTGYRVTSAKDDAASSAIASGLTSELGAFEKAHLNTSQASSLLKTMESGIEQVSTMVQRIEALVIQSQSAAISNKNLATLQSEVSGLVGQMNKIVNTTNFNGVPILSGKTSVTAYNPFQKSAAPDGGETTSDGEATTPESAVSNVYPAGLSYTFDSSIKPSAIEVSYTASSSEGCGSGVFTMTNLESGASQKVTAIAPTEEGTNTYYFDQIGAFISLDKNFKSSSFEYGVNSASTTGQGQILANSSGDVNCVGLLTKNNNIAITDTRGMINDVASTTVSITGTSAKSATFTLPVFTNTESGDTQGNFIANNIDLSTTGDKVVNLTRDRFVDGKRYTDSIKVQLVVTTAFKTEDLQGASSVTLAQLKNIVIADSDQEIGGELTFQVNTSAIGLDSDNQFSIALPSISPDSLGISEIDLTNTSKASTNLQKVRNALANLDLQRANTGVAQGQIEILQHNLEVSMENSMAARSALIDLDFAKGVLDLTNSTVRMQASQQAMQRANGMQSQLIQLLQA